MTRKIANRPPAASKTRITVNFGSCVGFTAPTSFVIRLRSGSTTGAIGDGVPPVPCSPAGGLDGGFVGGLVGGFVGGLVGGFVGGLVGGGLTADGLPTREQPLADHNSDVR